MASSLPDPSTFALLLAVGSAHVLRAVLGALDGGGAVLLALPILAAYLATAALTFAVRVAADIVVYAHAVAGGGDAAALLPALVAWLANMVAKLAVALLIFCALAVGLLHFSPVLL